MADFSMKANDLLPVIAATLTSGGGAVNLTTASGVKFIMALKSTGVVKVNDTATITDAASGAVEYAWTTGDTDAPGEYQAEWQVTWTAGSKPQTFPTLSYHSIDIVADLDGAP